MTDAQRDLGRVTLRWGSGDQAGHGELTVSASAHGFAGSASAWFDNSAIQRFGESIRAFPLPNDPVSLRGGYGRSADDLDEELVGIQLRQLGIGGQIGVDVHLATSDVDPGRPRPVGDVRLQLVTSYGQLELFAKSIELMMAGAADEAVLVGEHFSQDR